METIPKPETILFTVQEHLADKAGPHRDIRLVSGNVALSWATKKDLPVPGQCILIHEQPDHDASYA